MDAYALKSSGAEMVTDTKTAQAMIKAEMEARKAAQAPDDVTFKGGGGPKGKGKGKVGKLEVDRMEVRGSEMVRAMAPFTREISRAIRKDRPRTSLFGMGSLTVANGVE
jgi:hypothetical protein